MNNADSGNSLMDYSEEIIDCDWCNGTGKEDNGVGIVDCCECDGSGKLEKIY